MISIADIATDMIISKTFALAFPRFYKRTGISPKFIFSYSKENSALDLVLGFHPNEPTEEQYNILFEEINDAERLLLNDYLITNGSNFENIKQFVFKHREDMRQIIEKQKENV